MTLALPPNDHPPSGSPFAGHIVVFTGKLSSLGRREARALVKRLGGVPVTEVTARTTMLVVGAEGFASGTARGDGDAPLPIEREKSSKLRKAEEVNAKSPRRIRILSEDEFCRLGGLRSNSSLRQRYHSLRHIRKLYPLVWESRLRDLKAWGLNPTGRSHQCRHLLQLR